MIRPIFLLTLLFTAAPATAKDGEPHPLFADHEVIKLTITAPFNDLTRKAERSTDPYEATLAYHGDAPETRAIMLSARGNSRRNRTLCDFPPLRIEFAEKPEDESFFDGQKRLKLVTHCKRSSRFQQYYLMEYAAYRLFNEVTPLSLKVRMAEIDYVEAKNGKTVISRLGFLIEDTDDAAKRNDMVEVDTPDIDKEQLNADEAGRYAVFQYMIGNLDWSMHSGPGGKDCCHNTKLIAVDGALQDNLVPVPYDFDYSGLVNAPYAVPPENVPVRTVRQRRYRGFCAHNDQARAAAAALRGKQTDLTAILSDIPGLDKNTQKGAVRFLGDFFEDIADDAALEKNLLRDCRK